MYRDEIIAHWQSLRGRTYDVMDVITAEDLCGILVKLGIFHDIGAVFLSNVMLQARARILEFLGLDGLGFESRIKP